MFSYIVTSPLRRVASASSFCCVSTLMRLSICFEFVELRVHALFGALDQALADVEFAGAGVEFLAAFLQPFENGALGAGRQRGAVGRNDCAAARRYCRLGGLARAAIVGCRALAPLRRHCSWPAGPRRPRAFRLVVTEPVMSRHPDRQFSAGCSAMRTASAATPLPSGKLNICPAHDCVDPGGAVASGIG